MPTLYQNLRNNIRDISRNCPGFGDYYSLLGGENAGYCRGLVFMWGQAVLAGDKATYYRRLNILTRPYSQTNPLSQRVNRITKSEKRGWSNVSSSSWVRAAPWWQYCDLLLSIRAFLDGLLMYQCSFRSLSELADRKIDLFQWPEHISTFAANSTIQRYPGRQGLKKIFGKPFVGEKEDYREILSLITDTIESRKISFFISLTSSTHAVGIAYFFQSGKYEFYDANLMKWWKGSGFSIQRDGISSLMNIIYIAFSKVEELDVTRYPSEEFLAANIDVYVSSSDFYLSHPEHGFIYDSFYVPKNREYYDKYLPAIIEKGDHLKGSFLYVACANGHIAVVKKLLCAGADVNRPGPSGIFSLMIASQNGHIGIVRGLLHFGANVNQTDKTGKTPLHYACAFNNTLIVKELLRSKANVNQADKTGNTPFMIACSGAYIDLINLLIMHGQIDSRADYVTAYFKCAYYCPNKKRVEVLELLNSRFKGYDINLH